MSLLLLTTVLLGGADVPEVELEDGIGLECCSFYDRAFYTCEPTDWADQDPTTEGDIWTEVIDNASVWASPTETAATWARQGRC